MLCENPYMNGLIPCRCGQCDPCRNQRKKQWASRIMLESFVHGDSCFVTLTYDDEKTLKQRKPFLAVSLNPKHPQDWLKRLRLAVHPGICYPSVQNCAARHIRYYLAGEYGDKTWRPHYHAVLFGVSVAEVETIRSSWGLGNVVVGDLTPASAAYVAGYVTKKMTKKEDPRLNGKYPEFQRMSLKPGIGGLSISAIAKVYNSKAGKQEYLSKGDVPLHLTQAARHLPLGRYLRAKLRKSLGLDEKTPQKILASLREEMQKLLKENVTIASFETGIKKQLFKNYLLDKFKQERLNYNAKNKIYQGAKTI